MSHDFKVGARVTWRGFKSAHRTIEGVRVEIEGRARACVIARVDPDGFTVLDFGDGFGGSGYYGPDELTVDVVELIAGLA